MGFLQALSGFLGTPVSPGCATWLDKWNDFRMANWLDILEFPELIQKFTQQLLSLA